ncbi:MAG: iron-containing alcohol dehydrogenase [bacterium]
MISTFSFPTKIVFGVGAVAHLPAALQELGCRKPLLVTDKGVVASGLLVRVTDVLVQAGISYDVFDDVLSNPTEENLINGVARYQAEGCESVIALGGGSPLDMGKAIALMSTHAWPMEQYDDKFEGYKNIGPIQPPVIAVPTTAGTGSEVGRSTVITLKSTGRKTVIFSPHLMPKIALVDPELTINLPPKLTAATGMDALTHCVEAYLAQGYHPLCDAVALHGIKLVAQSLVGAIENGNDLNARADMMMAAIMGAVAFQKGLGVCHSLAHPLSTIAGLHHGLANAILLPYVLEFNRAAAAGRLADVAQFLVGDRQREPSELVFELNRRIGIPTRLAEAGVKREQIPALVEQAWEDACHLLNPRAVGKSDLDGLYQAAL